MSVCLCWGRFPSSKRWRSACGVCEETCQAPLAFLLSEADGIKLQSFLLLSTSGRAGCPPRGWTSACLDLILPLLGHLEAWEGQSKEGCPDVISLAYQGLWFGAPQVPGGTCPARSRLRGPSSPLPRSREDERKVTTSRGTSGGP